MQAIGSRQQQENRSNGDVTDVELEAIRVGSEEDLSAHLLSQPDRIDRFVTVSGRTISPIHLACELGRHKIVQIYIDAQVDVNLQTRSGFSPLYIASQLGHQQLVESLIKAQADVNFQDRDGCSPLYMASQYGHQLVVESLIKGQADVALLKNTGSSPLHAASASGHHRTVRSLIKAQADVNLQAKNGCSPLYMASQNGHKKVVGVLIKAQADVNLQEKVNGSTPLYAASQNGHSPVVDLLVEAKADVTIPMSDGVSPVLIASQQGHLQVVNSLVRAQADVNIQENVYCWSPVIIASQLGHHKVVESLIKAQADVDAQMKNGMSSLYMASQNGHKNVVDLLIKAQADVNLQESEECSPLFIASQQGYQQIVDSLIKAQANFNLQQNQGVSPLYVASQFGHQQVVQSLIEAQVDVNLQELSGCTPLIIASQNGHPKVVEALIKADADVNVQPVSGCSALYFASQNGHLKIVDALIKANADVSLLEKVNGNSALYIAAQNGHRKVVDSLIKAQADVNILTKMGCSPIYVAAQNGHRDVVESLIKAQADFNIPMNNGVTPLSVASQLSHWKVVDLLVKAQADVGPETEGNRTQDSPAAEQSSSGNEEEPSELLRLSDSILSLLLHSALNLSGFVESRATLQTAVADVLQEIIRKRLNSENINIVGSYSEGWGNNLKTLDGCTDAQSDIDVMKLLRGQLHHMKGFCDCSNDSVRSEYGNGHIQCSGFASNPALPRLGSALKPAVDEVTAGRLCRYPPIAPLEPPRINSSLIRASVLQSLRQDVASNTATPCHVVHAASPGRGGHELRVSTSFLEKRMLRSLTTLQGQLFVTLKYLVKKVICHPDGFNLDGLKPYHVKTITFRMLEETAAEKWEQPENLVGLVRQALQMLLKSVKSNCKPENTHGQVMQHFFLYDAALYLKRVKQKDSCQILKKIEITLEDVIKKLDQLLLKFFISLRPMSKSGRFYFHPFQILPDLSPIAPSRSTTLDYVEIYDVVRECLVQLSHGDTSLQSEDSLSELLARLPDCAFTAREALRALACLKFGNLDAAKRVLIEYRGHEVSRGIDWSIDDRSAAEATPEFVWQYLNSRDSAWKFCFQFKQPLTLRFLRQLLAECLPLKLAFAENDFFMNFDALLWALRFELQTESESYSQSWIRDVVERDDADYQELLVAVLFCPHSSEAPILLAKVKSILTSGQECFPLELMKKCMAEMPGRIQ